MAYSDLFQTIRGTILSVSAAAKQRYHRLPEGFYGTFEKMRWFILNGGISAANLGVTVSVGTTAADAFSIAHSGSAIGTNGTKMISYATTVTPGQNVVLSTDGACSDGAAVSAALGYELVFQEDAAYL